MQDAGISGLNSKTHMKIMLKWMRGRSMLKQICNQVGSNKKFLVTTLPEEPQTDQVIIYYTPEVKPKTQKPSKSDRKRAR